jgi:hypothetical protein
MLGDAAIGPQAGGGGSFSVAVRIEAQRARLRASLANVVAQNERRFIWRRNAD